jgi:fumarate hydratase class II
MNANEVIANLAIRFAGGMIGSGKPVHPHDDVNRSQSSNDVFPSVMHIAAVVQLEDSLIPSLASLRRTLWAKSEAYRDIVMVGRTHLQDATSITLGQVISGWASQLDRDQKDLRRVLLDLYELAIGGTAVGTGLNAPPRFGEVAARHIAHETGKPFVSARNKFAAQSAHDAMVAASSALRVLAGSLMKIANDLRWYASGPSAGIGELSLPPNEPGSSIMPGKVNPTQCEALTQVAVQVFGNDHATAFAGSQGAFQLNTFKPVILHNVLESAQLLAEACASFDERCARGFRPNLDSIGRHLGSSLTLATALSRHIGYDNAAEISLVAQRDRISLREAAIRSGYLTGEQFDAWAGLSPDPRE